MPGVDDPLSKGHAVAEPGDDEGHEGRVGGQRGVVQLPGDRGGAPEADRGDAEVVRQGEGALAVQEVHGRRVKASGSQVRQYLLLGGDRDWDDVEFGDN